MIVHIQTVEVFPVATNAVELMAGSISIINGCIRKIVISILAVIDAEYIIAAAL